MQYRIYWLGEDDCIKVSSCIECASDKEAEATAFEELSGYAAVEIWRGIHRISRLDNPRREQHLLMPPARVGKKQLGETSSRTAGAGTS